MQVASLLLKHFSIIIRSSSDNNLNPFNIWYLILRKSSAHAMQLEGCLKIASHELQNQFCITNWLCISWLFLLFFNPTIVVLMILVVNNIGSILLKNLSLKAIQSYLSRLVTVPWEGSTYCQRSAILWTMHIYKCSTIDLYARRIQYFQAFSDHLAICWCPVETNASPLPVRWDQSLIE